MIELLVVVAIIALLVSILLPSMAAARDNAYSAICLSNLKQMIMGSIAYSADYGDLLPGPLHVTIWRETQEVRQVMKSSYSSCFIEIWVGRQLPQKLRVYFGEKSKAARLADEIARCPKADKIKPDKDWPAPSLGLAPFSYTLNNYWTGPNGDGTNVRGTKPSKYFGFSNYNNFTCDRFPASNKDLWDTAPRKLASIPRASGEWAIADAWRFAPPLVGPGVRWMGSPWQHPTTALPTYPYHAGGRPDPTNKGKFNGKTNAVYFDGHAESVRPWRGTVNFNPVNEANNAGAK